MKIFKMDKWGQIPLIPSDKDRDTRWTVRPIYIFLVLAVIVLGMLLA